MARSRSTVDDAGAATRLAELLDVRPRLTYDEIRGQLREEGFDLSRSAIGRWSLEYEETRRRFRETLAQAKTLASGERAILALEEANASVLQSQLLEHLQTKRAVDRETLDIAYAVAALTSSASQRERVRFAREKAIRLAAKRITDDIKRELEKQPELARQLARVAKRSETALLEEEGRQ